MLAQKRRNGADVEIQPPSATLKKRRSSAEISGSQQKAVEPLPERSEIVKESIVVAEDPEESTSSSEKLNSPETTPPKQIDSDEM